MSDPTPEHPKGDYRNAQYFKDVLEREEKRLNKGVVPNQAAQLQGMIARQLAAQLKPTDRSTESRREWIESKLIIRDKQRQYVPLKFNNVQNKIWTGWEQKNFTGIRDEIVKFRQGGISTLVLAAAFEKAMHEPGTQIAIVSRDAFEVRRKLYTIKLFWRRLPDWEKPTLKYNNVSEMRFEGLESVIWVGAAGNRSFGRGDTIHFVLASEMAFWPDGEKLFTGLQEAVPDTGNIIVESTANGAGTYHHNHYLDARDNPDSAWSARFLPWFDHEEYQIFEGVDIVPTAEEERLMKTFHLTIPQLRWRRQKKASLKGLFPQEYPETDDEAFLYSGRPRFDRAMLIDIQKNVTKDPLTTENNESLKIYEHPKVDTIEGVKVPRRYTIGADAAEGIVTGDFDAAHVVDDETGVEVATLHGKWPLHEYADLLHDLGKRYHTAFLAVERNNHGHAVLQRLLLGGENREAYPRRGLYYHRSFDAKAGSHTEKLGWPTDAVTKPQMTANLETLIMEHPECFVDKATVSELLNIVYNDDGSVSAPAGAHDDRFISRSIAEHVRKTGARSRGAITIGGVVRAGPAPVEKTYRDPRGEEAVSTESPPKTGRWEPTEAEKRKLLKKR